ncbi:hypothetical protein F4821DRAFT_227360 [Hypoxylon rubiginosum]|uniref:Uncharacterized protein n=1 Tax=Hypoxylon rubiginosum TaxID=110542 RepID=A0ACC0DE82_9PEZI|nr:hypothetical protein F4821DRAFT_227360 [Hypoxylon rubiginosum]
MNTYTHTNNNSYQCCVFLLFPQISSRESDGWMIITATPVELGTGLGRCDNRIDEHRRGIESSTTSPRVVIYRRAVPFLRDRDLGRDRVPRRVLGSRRDGLLDHGLAILLRDHLARVGCAGPIGIRRPSPS